MKCLKCGHEFNLGIFCPECGYNNSSQNVSNPDEAIHIGNLANEDEAHGNITDIRDSIVTSENSFTKDDKDYNMDSSVSESHSLETNIEVKELRDISNINEADNGRLSDNSVCDKKMPFYYNMWFISIMYWVLGALFIGIPISLVLFILRIKNYPDHRKNAWISFGIQVGLPWIIGILIFISDAYIGSKNTINDNMLDINEDKLNYYNDSDGTQNDEINNLSDKSLSESDIDEREGNNKIKESEEKVNGVKKEQSKIEDEAKQTESLKMDSSYSDVVNEHLIREQLDIPDKASINIQYGDIFYNESGDNYLISVQVYGVDSFNNYMAYGTFDVSTGDIYSVMPWQLAADGEGNYGSAEVAASDGYVNLRKGPGTEYDIIIPISNGETLWLLEDEDTDTNGKKWLHVQYNNEMKYEGWVALSQIKLVD